MINYTRRNLEDLSGYDDIGDYSGISEASYIKPPYIYSSDEMDMQSKWWYLVQNVSVGILMIASFVLYLKGFKHNQISFFLQTLAFLGFTVNDPTLSIISFLQGMKVSYYQMIEGSLISIPDDFIESSDGNFPLITKDANIFRVASFTIVIALITTVLITTFRILYYCRGSDCLK
jgi:hypothetical protein